MNEVVWFNLMTEVIELRWIWGKLSKADTNQYLRYGVPLLVVGVVGVLGVTRPWVCFPSAYNRSWLFCNCFWKPSRVTIRFFLNVITSYFLDVVPVWLLFPKRSDLIKLKSLCLNLAEGSLSGILLKEPNWPPVPFPGLLLVSKR